MQTAASESGTHTAAWTSTAFFPPETHEDIHICMKIEKKKKKKNTNQKNKNKKK